MNLFHLYCVLIDKCISKIDIKSIYLKYWYFNNLLLVHFLDIWFNKKMMSQKLDFKEKKHDRSR